MERRSSRNDLRPSDANSLGGNGKLTEKSSSDDTCPSVPHFKMKHPNMSIDTVAAQQHKHVSSSHLKDSPTLAVNSQESARKLFSSSPRSVKKENQLDSPKPFDIDIKSLHLHLSTRVSEILACSESMWEWVLEEQEQYHRRCEESGDKEVLRQNDSDKLLAAIRNM